MAIKNLDTQFQFQYDSKSKRVKAGGQTDMLNIPETIEAYKKADDIRLEPFDKKIESIDLRVSDMGAVKGKILSIIENIKNYYGDSTDQGIMEALFITPISSTHQDASYYGDFKANEGVLPIQYTLNIERLAQMDQVSGATGIPSDTTPLNGGGTLTFGAEVVTITGADTLKTICDKVNNVSEKTGVYGEIIHGISGYKLVFSAQTTGAPLTFNNQTSGLDGILPASSSKSISDLSARFTFQGQVIEKTSNSFTINHIDMTLNNPHSQGTETISFIPKPATDVIVNHMSQTLVPALNDLFVTINDYISDGEKKEDKSIYRQIKDDFLNFLNYKVPGGKSLSDCGISMSAPLFQEDQKYTSPSINISLDTLQKAISTDFEGVKRALSFTHTGDSRIHVVGRPHIIHEKVQNQNITIHIDRNNNGNFSGYLSAGGVQTPFKASDIQEKNGYVSLKGPDGSIYQDWDWILEGSIASPSSYTGNLTSTQGALDYFGHVLEKDLSQDIPKDEEKFKDMKTNLKERKERLEVSLEKKRENLERQLERALQVITQNARLQQQLSIFSQHKD
jgi:hypothetical protein